MYSHEKSNNWHYSLSETGQFRNEKWKIFMKRINSTCYVVQLRLKHTVMTYQALEPVISLNWNPNAHCKKQYTIFFKFCLTFHRKWKKGVQDYDPHKAVHNPQWCNLIEDNRRELLHNRCIKRVKQFNILVYSLKVWMTLTSNIIFLAESWNRKAGLNSLNQSDAYIRR